MIFDCIGFDIGEISFKNTYAKTSNARLDAQIEFVAPDDKHSRFWKMGCSYIAYYTAFARRIGELNSPTVHHLKDAHSNHKAIDV